MFMGKHELLLKEQRFGGDTRGSRPWKGPKKCKKGCRIADVGKQEGECCAGGEEKLKREV